MPTLKSASQKSESIQIGTNTGSSLLGGDDEGAGAGGKWEDEEERRFYEEIPDLKDYVPRSVLGLEDGDADEGREDEKEKERQEKERVEEEVRQLEEELAGMKVNGDGHAVVNGKSEGEEGDDADE